MVDSPNITQNFGRPSYRPEASAGMDPDMRRMAIIAAGIGGLIAVALGMVSLSHHAHRAIPVIQAAAGPVRIKPLDPGGMKVVGAEAAASGVESLAAAAEKPAIHALRARARARAPELAHAAQPPALAAASLPQAGLPPRTTAVATPSAATPSAGAHAVPASSPTLGGTPTLRGTTVQLAAFETQQAAEQDWGKLAEKIPGLFNSHQPFVERAQVAGRTVYRLRTGGFADIASATIFCGRVRSHGGDCSIAAF